MSLTIPEDMKSHIDMCLKTGSRFDITGVEHALAAEIVAYVANIDDRPGPIFTLRHFGPWDPAARSNLPDPLPYNVSVVRGLIIVPIPADALHKKRLRKDILKHVHRTISACGYQNVSLESPDARCVAIVARSMRSSRHVIFSRHIIEAVTIGNAQRFFGV